MRNLRNDDRYCTKLRQPFSLQASCAAGENRHPDKLGTPQSQFVGFRACYFWKLFSLPPKKLQKLRKTLQVVRLQEDKVFFPYDLITTWSQGSLFFFAETNVVRLENVCELASKRVKKEHVSVGPRI